MRNRLGWGLLATTLLLALPAGAEAQGWLSDRSRAEGPGFQLGDFELHPGLGVEIGYDSNLFFTSDDDPHGIYRDSAILRATAHLMVASRGATRREEGEAGGGGLPTVTFRGGLSGSFWHFFNDNGRTNMEADASLDLHILPSRPFSITLSEQFGRAIRPFTENFATDASFARLNNTAAIGFHFATPGEVLKISLGYRNTLDFFEGEFFSYGDRMMHTVTLAETFRFLPQTAIVHDTHLTYTDFFNADSPSPVLVRDNFMLRTRAGLNGAITNEVSFLAVAGYTAAWFDDVPGMPAYQMDVEDFVAQLELRWQIQEGTRLALGYDRDVRVSWLGNFFRQDRGYVNFQTLIDGSFMIGAEASVGLYEFGAIVRQDGVTPVGNTLRRDDIRFIGSLFAEYRFTDWLGVNATARYMGAFTDYEYRVDSVDDPTMVFIDPAGFNKFEIWLGVRVFY